MDGPTAARLHNGMIDLILRLNLHAAKLDQLMIYCGPITCDHLRKYAAEARSMANQVVLIDHEIIRERIE